MRILAIDTSTSVCAAALLRDGVVVAERGEPSRSHAATLPQVVDRVLAADAGRLEPGDALAVAIGPGSFTGLRIGLSLAKGMAFAGGLRIVGVPTLDAWALAAPSWQGRLCAVLDARKQEVYGAVYEQAAGGVVRCGSPCAVAARRLAETLAAMDGASWTMVGDAVEVYGDVFRDALAPRAAFIAPGEHPSRASAVARLAAGRLAGEPEGDALDGLAPVYVRPPEAELKQSVSGPSQGAGGPAFVDKVPLLY